MHRIRRGTGRKFSRRYPACGCGRIPRIPGHPWFMERSTALRSNSSRSPAFARILPNASQTKDPPKNLQCPFLPDTVHGSNVDTVCHGMAPLDQFPCVLPVSFRGYVACGMPDGGRVEDDLCTFKGNAACGFREPLVVTDEDRDAPERVWKRPGRNFRDRNILSQKNPGPAGYGLYDRVCSWCHPC